MVDGQKDYYRILGVLEDAEDIVIKAAYRALAQRYHPDKWQGDPAEATRRMAAINEAYGVLSDAQKRAAYDATRQKGTYQEEQGSEADENASSGLSAIERDWAIAAKYHPHIQKAADDLGRLSKSLSFSFMLTLLETKQFRELDGVAAKIEKKWFTKFFGTNEDVHEFAKELILEGRRDAAKELNEAVRVIGSVGETVLNRIAKEFLTKRYVSTRKNPQVQEAATNIIVAIRGGGGGLRTLLESYGGLTNSKIEIVFQRAAWFASKGKPLYRFRVDNVSELSESEFLDWLRNDAMLEP